MKLVVLRALSATTVASTRRRVSPAVACLALAGLVCTACTASGSAGPSDSGSASPTASPTASGSGPATAPSAPARSSTRGHTDATTPVAPPTPGNVHSTVASRAVQTLAPAGLHASASFGHGVTVRPVSIKAIKAKAQGPGEIGGPAVEVTLRFRNTGARRADLRTAVVTVTDSEGDPTSTISGPPAAPVNGFLASGAARTGRYVFTLAKSRRKPITVAVATTASAPVVQFKGDAR